MVTQTTEKKKQRWYAGFVSDEPLFKTLDAEQRKSICDAFEPVDYAPGEIIIRQNDVGEDFFVIEDGGVEVLHQRDETSRPVVVCPELRQGAFFGEVALIKNARRSATVRALEDVPCLCIDRTTFDRILGKLDALKAE